MSGPASTALPAGFTLLERHAGPFLSSLGPLFVKEEGGATVLGLHIAASHLNTRGLAHGGMLVTLADSALGIALARARTPPQPMVTVSLSTDFTEAVRAGDWIEAHVEIDKIGARLAFATCHLVCAGRRVLRASGVFAVVARAEHKKRLGG